METNRGVVNVTTRLCDGPAQGAQHDVSGHLTISPSRHLMYSIGFSDHQKEI
jgi:hypothetical protein